MSRSSIRIKLLGKKDWRILNNVAEDLFDNPVQTKLCREFLTDTRHHLVVAMDEDIVVGFASGVHYVHPDKPAELFINEIGVAPSHQRHGIAKQLLNKLLTKGRALHCDTAWVTTEPENHGARALYTSAGGREDTTAYVLYTFQLNDKL